MISLDKIFFLLQSKGKFLNQFANNENLKNQANAVWHSLEDIAPFLLAITVVVGAGLAAYYYTSFNNQPGRHYKVKYWGIFAIVSLVLTFVVTMGTEYLLIKTNMKNGITSLYLKCAISNAIYGIGLYLLTSIVWCNWGRTNAYRLFKFKS
jgi:hypothetical protein